jgi:hypothetical protein
MSPLGILATIAGAIVSTVLWVVLLFAVFRIRKESIAATATLEAIRRELALRRESDTRPSSSGLRTEPRASPSPR